MKNNPQGISLPNYKDVQRAIQAIEMQIQACNKSVATLEEQKSLLQKEKEMYIAMNNYVVDCPAYKEQVNKAMDDEREKFDDEIEAMAEAGITAEQHERMSRDEIDAVLNKHWRTPSKIAKELTANPITGHLTVKEVETIFKERASAIAGTTQ